MQRNLEEIGKLLLRITVGGLMLFHGEAKLVNGITGIVGRIEALHLPGPLGYLVFLGELVAPVALIFGIWTRLAALVIVGNMIVAVLLAHTADLFSRSDTGGYLLELQTFYLLTACVIAMTGAGRYSLAGEGRRWN